MLITHECLRNTNSPKPLSGGESCGSPFHTTFSCLQVRTSVLSSVRMQVLGLLVPLLCRPVPSILSDFSFLALHSFNIC